MKINWRIKQLYVYTIVPSVLSGSFWFFYHVIACMFLANYISSKPRSHPGAKRMTFSFDSFTQQIFIILNKYSWEEDWGVLEELIPLFNKHLLSTHYVLDINCGAKHGGSEQDSKDFSIMELPYL